MDAKSAKLVNYATLVRLLQYIAHCLEDFTGHMEFAGERLAEVDEHELPLKVNAELAEQVHRAQELARSIPREMALRLVAALIGVSEELSTVRPPAELAFYRGEHDEVLRSIEEFWKRAAKHSGTLESVALTLLAELDLDNQPTMKTWLPSAGFVRRADVNILAKELGKRAVPDATLAGWRASDDPAVEIDPSTREICYDETWVRKRLGDYQPGRNARKPDDARNRESNRD